MTLLRVQSEFFYTSTTPSGQRWTFSVAVLPNGQLEVRDVVGPNASTSVPQGVHDDITLALQQSRNTVMDSSAFSGQVTFVNETTKTILFDTPMPDTHYRVFLEISDLTPIVVQSKSTTGFTILAGSVFSGTVGFSIFF